MLNQSIRYDGLLLSVGQDGNLKITLLFHTLLCSVSVTTLNNVVSCLGFGQADHWTSDSDHKI